MAIRQLLARAHVLPLADMRYRAPLLSLCGSACQKTSGPLHSHARYAEYDEYGPIRDTTIKWRRASSGIICGDWRKLDCTLGFSALCFGHQRVLEEALGGCRQGLAGLREACRVELVKMRQLCLHSPSFLLRGVRLAKIGVLLCSWRQYRGRV